MPPPATCLIRTQATAWHAMLERTHGNAPLAEIQDLGVRFVGREATVHAVNGVSFAVRAGEVVCILGESGSGKSVTLRALMRLLPRQARIEGSVRIGNEDVLAMPARQLRDLRVRAAKVGPIERRQYQAKNEPGDELPENRGLSPASRQLTTHLGCDQHDRSLG